MSLEKSPLILSLETATRAGSISVFRGETLLATRSVDSKISHSTNLLNQIKSALDQVSLSIREMEAFAVAAGPGGFTGLRIGLATAKAFASTLRRPCFGVPTLHAVAFGAGESSYTVAVLPAGRGEVFAQLLAITAQGQVLPLEAPIHISPDKLLERVSSIRNLKWAGEGAQLYAETLRSYAISKGLEFLAGDDQTVEKNKGDCWSLQLKTGIIAKSVGRLALSRIQRGEESLPQDVRAIYVRPSDAELNTSDVKNRGVRRFA